MYETIKSVDPNGVTKSDGTLSNKNTSGKFEVELKYSF
jgi:hypothetical protein